MQFLFTDIWMTNKPYILKKEFNQSLTYQESKRISDTFKFIQYVFSISELYF